MEKCKRQSSVKNSISTGINFSISSLALNVEEGKNLGEILNTELQEYAYFCHVPRGPTCIACGAKQSGSREELAGGAEAGKPPPPAKANEGNRGVTVAYPAPWGVKTFWTKHVLSLSTPACATEHGRLPSHPHLLRAATHGEQPGWWSGLLGLCSLPSAGETWFIRAKNGSLQSLLCGKGESRCPLPWQWRHGKPQERGRRGTGLSCSALGQRRGKNNINFKSQLVLEGWARDAVMKGLVFWKESGLTSGKIYA